MKLHVVSVKFHTISLEFQHFEIPRILGIPEIIGAMKMLPLRLKAGHYKKIKFIGKNPAS